MASCSKDLIIIATIFSALLVSILAQAEAGDAPEISSNTLTQNATGKCQKGGDFNTCFQAVKAELRKIRQQSHRVQVILGQAKKSHPEAAQALDSCVTDFGSGGVLRQLRTPRESLEFGEASLNLMYAMDSVKTCDHTLAQQKINITTVSDGIREWKSLFNSLWDIVAQAEDNYRKSPPV